jgi:peroxiredoxin Q/BCP
LCITKHKTKVANFLLEQAATPGCTKEACKFRDEYSVFKDAGAEVLGISSDSPDANAAFAKAQRLPFPLLSDEDSAFRKALGVKNDLFGLLPGRQVRRPPPCPAGDIFCNHVFQHHRGPCHRKAENSMQGSFICFYKWLSAMQTFVFDKDGKVALVFNSQLRAEKHIEEALNVIKTLK